MKEPDRPVAFTTLLALEPAGEDAFLARLHDFGGERSFGGDVLGRAVLAVRRTCERERRLCSFYGLFLRPGPVDRPVRIEVERVKEGRRLAQRRARMLAGDKLVADVTASFGVMGAGPSYQDTAPPETPGPEALPSDAEVARSEGLTDWRPGEVEWRWVERGWQAAPGETSTWRAWARPRSPLPDDPGLHEAALAFLSDMGSHWSVVRTLGDAFVWERFASVDQGLWVHGPVRWDDWWLIVSESEIARDGHTFTRRRIFDRSGRPVATGSQEGIHPDG